MLPWLLAAVVTLGWSTTAVATTTSADLLLFGGTIYTLADDRPSTVDAVAIADGVVIATGNLEEVRAVRDERTQLIDLKGAVALPGLVDAHAHLANLGLALARAQLRGTRSAAECVERARVLESTLAAGEWLLGRGWDQNDWTDTRFPTKEILDEAFGDRPVSLSRIDGHALWVNSAALRAAGIDRDTNDPAGGEIVRDPATGEPTGILIDAAESLVKESYPSTASSPGWRSIVAPSPQRWPRA